MRCQNISWAINSRTQLFGHFALCKENERKRAKRTTGQPTNQTNASEQERRTALIRIERLQWPKKRRGIMECEIAAQNSQKSISIATSSFMYHLIILISQFFFSISVLVSLSLTLRSQDCSNNVASIRSNSLKKMCRHCWWFLLLLALLCAPHHPSSRSWIRVHGIRWFTDIPLYFLVLCLFFGSQRSIPSSRVCILWFYLCFSFEHSTIPSSWPMHFPALFSAFISIEMSHFCACSIRCRCCVCLPIRLVSPAS